MNTKTRELIPWTELILPFVFLLVGVAFLIESNNINVFGFGDVILTALYPQIIAILLVLISASIFVVQLVKTTIKIKKGTAEKVEKSPLLLDWKKSGIRLGVFMVLMIAYVLLMPYIGYFETGLLFLTTSIYLLGDRTLKWFLKSLVVSVVITLVIYFIFGYLLNIYVPSGIIFKV
ncbi:tripartite tricarboxylate transporter TctB family protein [Geomicrobium sp. JCM 19038]|uniref:tripartite tricarboxylate transporter TctB family protein n=1 Tax=Geomicrobium sp. JCM 19038 TaxID=1460635 RepID=UPI00045F205A|nr:tripartite tricarboxylate transporter TctB family protein [Geomicrobium sp. JCM 19038]GAK07084.1 hypothetical protein JCM19038_804 [Geomicrobium sp. JCM 19038]